MTSSTLKKSALFITFWTGFTALVYEVTWQKYLANLLGSQAKATALILAIFLGGLSLGYHLFGKVSLGKTPRTLLKACGWAEIGIGAWAILFPMLYNEISPLSDFFPDFFICILLIGFPTVCMGSTLPLLTQGLSQSLKDSVPIHAKIYAINTAGAFLGCLVGGFLLLPSFGLPLTMMGMGGINLLGGLGLVALGTSLPLENVKEGIVSVLLYTEKTPRIETFYSISIAFLSGFIALSLQTLMMRVFGFSLGSSEYSFCTIVAVYILMLALGALQLSRASLSKKLLSNNQILALFGLMGLYIAIPYFPYGAYVIRTLFMSSTPGFYVYYFFIFIVFAFVLALPIGAMGKTMPLLFQAIQNRFSEVGSTVGKIYTWNTIGCIAGALGGGFWFLSFANIDQVFKICITAMALLMLLATLLEGSRKSTALVILFSTFIFCYLTPHWNTRNLTFGLFRNRTPTDESYKGAEAFYQTYYKTQKVIAYRDDPNTSVGISEAAAPNEKSKISRSIFVNGKSDGATGGGDLSTMRLAAHLPALFSASLNTKAAVIGYGTGTTVGSLGLYEGIQEIHCLEISQAVRDFAHYFDFSNHNASLNPKLHWHLGDAFREFAKNKTKYGQKKYGMIISEPSNPWVAGVERLFSSDFYKRVIEKLEDSGIYVQWYHTYEISQPTVSLVINTFASVFPHVRIFALGPDLIMLGTKTPLSATVLTVLNERFQNPEIKKELEELGIRSPEELLALELPLSTQIFKNAGIHTLEFPKLTYQAGKDFFRGLSTNLWQLLEFETIRPLSREGSTHTLLSAYLKQGDPHFLDRLKNVARISCGLQKEVQFFPGWDQRSTKICRDSLVALAAKGAIPPENGFTPDSARRLQELAQDPIKMPSHSKIKNELKVLVEDERKIDIRLFASSDSVFLPLSEEKLFKKSATCFDGESEKNLKCRTQLIEALFYTGRTKSAQAQYKLLKDNYGQKIPTPVLERLGQLTLNVY